MDGERRGGRARVRAGRKGVGRSAEGRMRSAEWCPCAVHVSRFTFHVSRLTFHWLSPPLGAQPPPAAPPNHPVTSRQRAPPPPFRGRPYRLPNLNPNPNLGSLPPSPDSSMKWRRAGERRGVWVEAGARFDQIRPLSGAVRGCAPWAGAVLPPAGPLVFRPEPTFPAGRGGHSL
jgi:hypothetical protein